MPIYETVFIARQDMSETEVEDLCAFLQKIITDQGGSILKTESWGLRTLAYRIKKNRRGHYGLIEYDAPGAMVAELERQMRLSDDVLRALTVRRDEPSKNPSPIISRRERDDDERKFVKQEAI